jgi:hypothetical protein
MNADNGKGELIPYQTVEAAHANMSEAVELIARAGTTDQYRLVYVHCDVGDPDHPVISPIYSSYPKSVGTSRTIVVSQQKNRIATAKHYTENVDIKSSPVGGRQMVLAPGG